MVPGCPFIPGLQLSERFYWDVVRPLLDATFPAVPHSAALLGPGSEVLGYDTERSTDHDWSPRVQLFFGPQDLCREGSAIRRALTGRLPSSFGGYPVSVEPWPVDSLAIEPQGRGTRLCTVSDFLLEYLGFHPGEGISAADWLTTPSQRLLEITAGTVFFDGLDELTPIREMLRWYPHDIWCYLLACQWGRIGQEEGFVGRTGEVGDEIGSRMVAARLTRDLMRLCFLIERRYAPYAKWLGTDFARLACSPLLGPILSDVLTANDWRTRERYLGRAYTIVAERFNGLHLAEPVDPTTRPYFTRPFTVIGADRFVSAVRHSIVDDELRSLPLIGSVDQFADSTDVLTHPDVLRQMAVLYTSEVHGSHDHIA